MRIVLFLSLAILNALLPGSAQVAGVQAAPLEIAVPRYPLSAFTSNTAGNVEVELSIDASGAVVSVKTLRGPYSLRSASEKAASKWRFPESRTAKTWSAKVVFDYKHQTSGDAATQMSSVYKPPFRVEVIGEDESTVIMADPPVELGKPKKSKNK